MIFVASTLAQNALPANAGIIIVLVMLIAVFGLGALLWSAVADKSSKETPSSSVRVLRAPTAASQPKTETVAVAAPVADAPAVVAAPQAVAPVKPPKPAASKPAVSKPAVVAAPEPEPLPEEPAIFQPAPGEPDDLQRLEGIGPKIAGVLADDGVTTYAQLALMTPDQIRAILTGKVRLFNPDTWPEQAQLAAAGRWDELVEFQRTLKAGRRA